MRKKLLAILLSGVCVLTTVACGATSSENVTQTEETTKEEEAEVAQAVASQSTEAEEGAESVETEVSEDEETETTETTEEPEYNPVIWRMNEEGLQNDELGVMLRRDNGILEKLSLKLSMQVFWEDEDVSPLIECACDYYAGDLDDYIAENSGFEKGMLGNECEYAYQIYESNDTKFAFVGNGVALTMYVSFYSSAEPKENVNINDYLATINLQPYKEFSQDCLAYMTDEGLYCPAVGVAITYEEGKNEINGHYAWVSPDDGDYSRFLQISSYRGTGSAQEIVDSYVKKEINDNTEGLEGTVETTIAGYKYLGRGVIYHASWGDEDNREKWEFVSDDIRWSIDFWCTEAEGHEAYLSILEPLP